MYDTALAHLDLDTIAWQDTDPPQRKAQNLANLDIDQFLEQNHSRWVVEGCYADLLSHVSPKAEMAIFMNLPISKCQENARNRPWEPHKYDSKEAQDANLSMLLNWIEDYEQRADDSFSKTAHQRLFDEFNGEKVEVTDNMSFLDFSQRWLN